MRGLDWLKTMRTQIQEGLTFNSTLITLNQFMVQWLGSIRTSIRPKTYNQYSYIALKQIIPTLGKIKLKDLRPEQIQALYNAKLDNGISQRTVQLIHVVLHRALGQALKQGLIIRNPTQAVTRPRVSHKEMMVLSGDQARSFLSAAQNTRYETLYYLAIHTGMREGELLGLKWCDLDWVTKRLQVKRQLQHISGHGLVFSEPKTAAGRRMIVLSPNAIEKLRSHSEKQNVERQLAGSAWVENDLIFPTKLGSPMYSANMYKIFKGVLKLASLPNIRFHDLRHTAATLMLQQGVHPKVVQERLGHSDITQTLGTYSHVLPSMQEEAADKLDEVLTPINVSQEIKKLEEVQASYELPLPEK